MSFIAAVSIKGPAIDTIVDAARKGAYATFALTAIALVAAVPMPAQAPATAPVTPTADAVIARRGEERLPTAASILDRYIEVTGGRAAYENRTSEITHSTLEYTAAGIQGSITRYASPDRYYMVMDIPGLGAMELGVRDGVAWERSDVMGPHIREGAERAEALREATLNASLHWRDLFVTSETTGIDQVAGEDCYSVVQTPESGHPQTTCFSIESGLALKVSAIAASQMGDVPVETAVNEYQNLGGILAPSKVTINQAGQSFTVTTLSVEANADIPAERFEFPADIQALLETAETPDR